MTKCCALIGYRPKGRYPLLSSCSIIFVNTFICVHASSISEENETATISSFLHLFTLHVTKRFSLNILKTTSLKIEKKSSIEAQSEYHALVHKTSESHLAD